MIRYYKSNGIEAVAFLSAITINYETVKKSL